MADWLIVLVIGGLFILFGLGLVFWDRREKMSYFNGISTRSDAREFLVHDPERPEFGALKMGGWIAVGIGLSLLIMGTVLWIIS